MNASVPNSEHGDVCLKDPPGRRNFFPLKPGARLALWSYEDKSGGAPPLAGVDMGLLQ